MATAKKLPSGNWNVLVYSHTDKDGKRKYKSFTAPTKVEAQRLAAEFSANRHLSESPYLTVEQAMKNYIEVKTPVLSPATVYLYKKQIRNYYGDIDKKVINTLTDADVQKWISNLSLTQSPKSVRNIYGLFSSAVKMYCKLRFDITLPQKSVVERHIPVDEQVKQLMDMADPETRLCIALAAIGTLRRGEVCGLTYKDVIRDKNAVYVHTDYIYAQGGWIHKEMPKTDASVRYVILPKEVIDMIGDGEPDERIIKHTPATVTDRFTALRNSVGLKCRFHDLRHYAASVMHSMGIPDVYIMERGGWETDATLKSIYRNSLSDKAHQFTEKANIYFEKMVLSEDMQDEIQDNDITT